MGMVTTAKFRAQQRARRAAIVPTDRDRREAVAKITVTAEIVDDGGQWWVNTSINDELLAHHGPMPTQELAEKVAMEQINAAKKILMKAAIAARESIVDAANQ